MTETADAAAGGEVMTPAEQAYFESGGASTDGLVSDETSRNAAADTTGQSTVVQSEAGQNAGSDQNEETDPGLDADGKPKNPGQWVRHGALHAERERRKKVEVELQVERDKRRSSDELLQMIADLQRPAQTRQPEAPPDPAKDMLGYVRYLERKVAEVDGRVGESVRATEALRADAAMRDAYAADARRFSESTPDFGAAYQHLLRSRDQELAMVGNADPQQRAAEILAEERSLVARALQNGTSPAEFVYRLAQSRGYQSPGSQEQGAGRAGKAPVAAQIETIQRGQAAAKSLSNVGGAAGDTVTPEALATMPDDEFRALFDRLSKAKQREMLGG